MGANSLSRERRSSSTSSLSIVYLRRIGLTISLFLRAFTWHRRIHIFGLACPYHYTGRLRLTGELRSCLRWLHG